MARKKQILVVEDNWLNRQMLVEILEEQYQVLEANQGLQALEILRDKARQVDLILLDMQMPVMDGKELLERIKHDTELSLIPVIVTTQSDSEEDEIKALALGATDFVPKPYRPQVILHRVASIINLRETAATVNQLQFDRLTGLYSKEFFFSEARRLLEEPDKKYTMVCSDVEKFKLYNDAFGVPAGDRMLRQLAEQIRECVGAGGICGRYGSDRFMVLLDHAQGQEECEKMKQALAEGRSPIPGDENVVIKWGVYEISDRSVTVEQMCDRALLAADGIKDQYHKWVAIYDDKLRNKLLREQAITESMEKALAEGQFVAYLQPKYSLHEDGLAGAEALVRWNHPEWGFVLPGEFVPLFEKNGFITQLDEYIWEMVCKLLRQWQDKGYPELPVSVNVSRADIYQVDLPQTLLQLVRKYGLHPRQLHLEVTESAYTENPAQIIAVVDKLRKLGFIIEMDDFGSGYSSLNMLNQMKLDVLKLDMKFIQSETAKTSEQGILHFIVSLARWMNLTVTAEGVETKAQLERLREIGCGCVQGYYFAKPMPPEDYEALLALPNTHTATELPRRPVREEGASLLIVEEDAGYVQRVRDAFENRYRMALAEDAETALAYLRDPQNHISTVILSASLPNHGAERLLAQMRRDPVLWRVPVLSTIPFESVCEELPDLDTDDLVCKCHPMSNLRKRVSRLMGMAAFQERERMLRDDSCKDYATGLLNRRGMYAAVDSLRKDDLPLAGMLFDVDNLGRIDEKLGHGIGEGLLVKFSQLLRGQTREGDILCRYGGDEFLVILRCVSSPEAAERKAEQICQMMGSILLPDGNAGSCTCGLVWCGEDQNMSAQFFNQADEALAQAKQVKRGGCLLWEK